MIDGKDVPVAGLLVRDVDALASAVIAAVGEGGQVQLRRRPVQGPEQVRVAGGSHVVVVTGDDLGGPDRMPVRTHDRLHVPAEGPVFPGVPGMDRRAFRAGGGVGAAVGTEDLAVHDYVRPALLCDLVQRLVQVRSLGGQHRGDLIAVAVTRRPGDAEPGRERGHLLVLAEPDQPEQCLLPAAQRPGVAAGATTAAFAAQQAGEFVDQFAGDVEHGTIGDHVGSLGGERSCGENSLPRTPRPRWDRLDHPKYPCRRAHGPHLAEITSVYCKDDRRRLEYGQVTFTFCGYAFRPRKTYDRVGKRSRTGFLPAVAPGKLTDMSRKIASWGLHRRTTRNLESLAEEVNPVLRGWLNYFTVFYPSAVNPIGKRVDRHLMRWARRKYKRLERSEKRARDWLSGVRTRAPGLFAHWALRY